MEHDTISEVHKYFNLLFDSKENEAWRVDPSKIVNGCVLEGDPKMEEKPDMSNFHPDSDFNFSDQLKVESSDPIYIKKENADKTLVHLANESYGNENYPETDLSQCIGTPTISDFTYQKRFPYTLWKLANEKKDDAIRWTENGNTFFINEPLFETKYLDSGLFFRTKKIRSFIRQLNLYGFRKLTRKRNENKNEFQHRFFKRDQPDLLELIQRKSSYVKRELFSENSESKPAKNIENLTPIVPKPAQQQLVCFDNNNAVLLPMENVTVFKASYADSSNQILSNMTKVQVKVYKLVPVHFKPVQNVENIALKDVTNA